MHELSVGQFADVVETHLVRTPNPRLLVSLSAADTPARSSGGQGIFRPGCSGQTFRAVTERRFSVPDVGWPGSVTLHDMRDPMPHRYAT
jgi:hypothetical protein